MKETLRISSLFLTLGTLLLVPGQSQAVLWKFDVALDGLQEVAPVATPGYGDAMALLNDITGQVDVSGNYYSLIGTATFAHIHGPAPVGVNAGIIVGLTHTGGSNGTLSLVGGVLSPANVTNALSGLTYINVHSTFRTGGEIRGQLLNPMRIPEPTTIGLMATACIGLLAFHRWRKS